MDPITLFLLMTFLACGCSAPEEAIHAPDAAVHDAAQDTHDTTPQEDETLPEDTGPDQLIAAGCNPLAYQHDCMLPFPSDFFLIEDLASPTGKRVELNDIALPHTESRQPINFLQFYPTDGFSPHMPITALFPEGVDMSNIVFHTDDFEDSLVPTSSTVLLEADTRVPVPHFAELDHTVADESERVLMIRPYVRLKPETRYIVAFHGLRSPAGAAVSTPEGFRQIRDGRTEGQTVLETELERYERDIFPTLTAYGIERDELQLAWDFTTRSQEGIVADMLEVRRDVLERLAQNAPEVRVTAVDEDVNADVFRQVHGTITVPLYLTEPGVEGRLHRDESGQVVVNGEVDVPFVVVIPRSVAALGPEDSPARLVQYGHGFFGRRDEIQGGLARTFANNVGVVTMAVDWWGMSADDRFLTIERLLLVPGEALLFSDRIHQAMANQLAMTVAAQTLFSQLEELQVDGRAVVDPSVVYFYGLSQGHIMGSIFLALSPTIKRGVLGVGGASFSLMMSRSANFRVFLLAMEQNTGRNLELMKNLVLMQFVLDRIDPISYAGYLSPGAGLPGGPEERHILMHVAIGDTAVPNLASHLHARTMGVPLLQPTPRTVALIPTVESPTDGSAMVESDFELGVVPDLYSTLPTVADETGVHDLMRTFPAFEQQIDTFLHPGGLIVNYCDGPCTPD
ncbi:MAG: hypothetical protein ACNA8W_09180 [Bradymonadaceae bacterium]